MKITDRFTALEARRLDSCLHRATWMLFSKIGRTFFNRPPPHNLMTDGKRYLNLACGSNYMNGWINADFFKFHHLISSKAIKPDFMLDITQPMNCVDSFFSGVLIEHANEHLLYSENYLLFVEVFRVLESGGVLRIIVPDLDLYLQWHTLRHSEQKMARFGSLPEAISNLTQNHSHKSVWNFDLLKEVLLEIGFKEVNKINDGASRDRNMRVGLESHRWESLFVEAAK